jgi:uncharacterized protein (DUF433 family)
MLKNNSERWRRDPIYTIAEAAHLAKVSHQTVRNWLYGYPADEGTKSPILGAKEKGPLVSFLQLAEIIIVSGFRKNRIKTERIALAHNFMQKEWGLEFPFAHEKLEPLGGHLLHRFDEEEPGASLATLDTELKQWTLPRLVIERLHNFDYELDFVSKWYPIGKSAKVVVNPRYSAGKPTILDRRVTVEAIIRRLKARYSISFISSDLRISREAIEDALRYAVPDEVAV